MSNYLVEQQSQLSLLATAVDEWGRCLRSSGAPSSPLVYHEAYAEWIAAEELVIQLSIDCYRSYSDASATGQPTHIFQSGDTLWNLAARYLGDGNRWAEIARLNGIGDPNAISNGTLILIPGGALTATSNPISCIADISTGPAGLRLFEAMQDLSEARGLGG